MALYISSLGLSQRLDVLLLIVMMSLTKKRCKAVVV